MLRHRLADDAWDAIRDLYPAPARTGRPPTDPRLATDGMLWILRTGAAWRDLPAEFGPWQTIWHLFNKWNQDGLLDAILKQLRAAHVDVGDIDPELWCIDDTIVRAARCAAGGGKKKIPTSRPTMPSAAPAAVSRRKSTCSATGVATPCTSSSRRARRTSRGL